MKQSQIIVGQALIVKNGMVLVGLRLSKKPLAAYKLWELPAGKVHFGETPLAATVREVREETGYRVRAVGDITHIANVVWRHKTKQDHVVLITYQCKVVGGNLVIKQKINGAWKWIAKADYKSLKFTPGSKQALRWWFFER